MGSEPTASRQLGGLRAYVPGWTVVSEYQRRWLAKDVVAGLVLSALLVPQGMAYAELAGLPAITGLYTSILCLVGYAVFGPSRVLVLGPDSALGPMIAATVTPLLAAGGDPAKAVALASLLAILVGVIMVVAGLAKFGFVADLLSKPTQIGYMNGLAVTIVVGQLPKLFGFSVDANGLLSEFSAFVTHVADDASAAAATVGLASLAGILLLQRLLPKVPAVLVAVVLASLAVKRSTCRLTASTRSACCREDFRRSPSRPRPGLTCRRCSLALSRSRSLPSPTPCRPRRRSRPGMVSGCGATRR